MPLHQRLRRTLAGDFVRGGRSGFFSSSYTFHLDFTTALYHWRMRHVIINFVLVISILQGMAAAQTPYVNRYPEVEELLQRLWLSGEMQAPTEAQIQIAKRKEAEYKQKQFLLKAKKLVQSWSTFAHEYNEKGTFNLKTARDVSKAFHDLEKDEGWPKMR